MYIYVYISVSKRFCMRPNSAAPDAFADYLKVTNHIRYRARRICISSFEHRLGILCFRLT